MRNLVICFIVVILSLLGCDSKSTEPEKSPTTVKDIDGNVYHMVTIGDQVWMHENLRVTHYHNGDAIPNVTVDSLWGPLTTGAYCNYDNDESNVETYGRLYNWFVIGDSRNIAPEGWHVPSDAEWQTLIDSLGGMGDAGGKMKEAGTEHWISPNTGATNESGFSALPGGCREYTGDFIAIGYDGLWWSATETDEYRAMYLWISCDRSSVTRIADSKKVGFSIRCIKD